MHRLTALSLAALTALTLAYGTVTAAPAAPITTDLARAAVAGLAAEASAAQADAFEVRAENTPTFSGVAANQHVQALAVTIGSRPAGAAVQDQTHQYLLSQLQAMGYQAELQSFPITAYQDRGSRLAVSATGTSVDVNTIQYSIGGDVQGVLVEAGLGRPEEMEAAGVAGRIVLVNRGDIRFVDKVNAATAAGALGVVIANNQPGNFNGSLIGTSTIPAVSVSQADGETLRQVAQAGGSVQITVDASVAQTTGANVVATRPGGPRTLVVGAHIDSVSAGPGANDNGSGTAVMLELARVMASRPTPFTLKFVGFDAEEIGLVGSNYYVSQLSEAERRSVVGMINLDMVGVGTESRVGGSDGMVRLARAAATAVGLPVGEMGEAGASDHASFIRAGMPALFIYRSNDPNYHSPNDRAEYIDPANLQIAGQLALDVISALERGE
ncbi:MAG: M20/M25/M40 family metallo-hydrolase [Chloroflexi bacterium]|nr:M20/M25/M40 family metallo-hydrolase [Chloroflexota bacterium]